MEQLPNALSEAAECVFRGLKKQLESVDQWNKSTELSLLLLAEHYSIYSQAMAMLAKEGLTVGTERGSLKAHPLCSVAFTNSALILKILAELRLTPRTAKVQDIPDEDLFALDQLL